MSKEKFNQTIDRLDVPLEKLMAREKVAIIQAKRKNRRKIKRSFFVACGLCMGLLGSGFVSTGMANALANVPFIGPIYKEFGDIASDKIQHEHLATVIEKEDTRNGLTMTVKEAVYDGGRLIVTVIYSGQNELSLQEADVGYGYVTINGQTFNTAIGSTGQESINPNTIIEHNEFTLTDYDQYGDNIEVAVYGENLFGYKGEWNVSFPLEKVKGDIYEFYPQAKAETNDKVYTLTAEKITFSPLATRLDLTVDYPAEMDENDTWPWFDFSVVDDQGIVYEGIKLQQGMAGENGRHMVLSLPPMDTLPKSLTLKPRDINSAGLKEDIWELELVVPLTQEK